MEKYIEASQLPEDEKVYLKKGSLGWKVVYPIKDDNGKINLKHLIAGGSWWNLVIIALMVFVILGFLYEYNANLSECSKFMSDYNLKQNISYAEITDITRPLTLNYTAELGG